MSLVLLYLLVLPLFGFGLEASVVVVSLVVVVATLASLRPLNK